MKVKELLKKIKEIDPNLEVDVVKHYHDSNISSNLRDEDIEKEDAEFQGWVRINITDYDEKMPWMIDCKCQDY